MIPVMSRMWMPKGESGNSLYKDFRTGNDIGTYTTYGNDAYTSPNHLDTFTQSASGLTIRAAGGNERAFAVFDDFDTAVDEFTLTVNCSLQWTLFGSGTPDITIGHGLATPVNGLSTTLWAHKVVQTNANIVYTSFTVSNSITSGQLIALKIVVSASAGTIKVYVDDVLKIDEDLNPSPAYQAGPIAFGMWRFVDSDATVTFKDALLVY